MRKKSLSHVRLFAELDSSPLGFSAHGILQQEYRSGLSCRPPGDLPNPGTEAMFLCFLHWQVDYLPLALPGKPPYVWNGPASVVDVAFKVFSRVKQ